jgi:hypothetical protein
MPPVSDETEQAGRARRVGLGLTFCGLISFAVTALWITFFIDSKVTQNFVTEDGYFYVKTAHNFASHFKFTFDGINETNGFHVLHMVELVLLDRMVPLEGLQGARAVILLHVGISLVAFLVAGLFIGRMLGVDWRPAGVIAVGGAQSLHSIGTEAALLLFVGWAFLLALLLEQRNLLNRVRKPSDRLWVVGLAAAVTLARQDAALLVLSAGLVFSAWHYRTSRRNALMTCAITILPAIVILAGESAVNLLLTGHGATISAYLKNDFPDFVHNEWFHYRDLRDKARVVGPTLLAIAVAPLIYRRIRSDLPNQELAAWLCWLGFSIYTVFYSAAIYLFAIGEGTLRTGAIQEWYFVLTMSYAAISGLILVREAFFRLRQTSMFRAAVRWAPVLVAVVALAAGGLRTYRFYSSYPTPDVLDMATADWIRDNLPQDARIYVIDHAGVLGYYSERSVVNGDGLINGWGYWQALRDGTLEDWLAENDIGYVAMATVADELQVVGRVELRDGSTYVIAHLALKGARTYELIARAGSELYQVSDRWVFPMSEISIEVLD